MTPRHRCPGKKPRPRRFDLQRLYALPGLYPGATKRNALVLLLYLLALAYLFAFLYPGA
ncbi:MAG: hypothetical protein V5A46_12235 [Haloferacaceae archaeon]